MKVPQSSLLNSAILPTAEMFLAAIHGCITDVATEPDMAVCQWCRDLFEAHNGEWFCEDCIETVPVHELELRKKTAEYYFAHGGSR